MAAPNRPSSSIQQCPFSEKDRTLLALALTSEFGPKADILNSKVEAEKPEFSRYSAHPTRDSLSGTVRGHILTQTGDTARRLVAVFAADVEGYSRLMAVDEVGTLNNLTQRRGILERLIASHRGRIANTAGDSVLAEFSSAVDAVQCAVDAQAALAEANATLPSRQHINFRIGIHVGDVIARGRSVRRRGEYRGTTADFGAAGRRLCFRRDIRSGQESPADCVHGLGREARQKH